MGKTLAIIGASYLQRPLVLKAKEMGLRTVCFAWKDGAVCASDADCFYPISVVAKDLILEICKKEKVDGVCTIASDIAAPTVAYVAESLGLTGNSYTASLKANDKGLMRRAFQKAGVPCPWFAEIHDSSQLDVTNIKFPLIVKPTDRSGSLGVVKVNGADELRKAVTEAVSLSFSKSAIIEEFVQGKEISVEFISYSGCHYPLAITDKTTTGEPQFVELEHHQPSNLDPDTQNRVYNLTVKALDALGITNGASHTEYKITSDGRIIIMELGARMGGDFIGSDLVPLSTGYDFVKGVIEVALGNFSIPIRSEQHFAGVYFLCEDTKYLLPVFKGQKRLPGIVRIERTGQELRRACCSADRSGYFIYQTNRKLEL